MPFPTPRTRALVAAAVALLVAAGAGAEPARPEGKARGVAPEVPELNRKVVEFARDQVGKQVGDGECTGLVVEALRHAGARRFRSTGRDGDYVWGRPVASFAEALPGDVLQFRDAVFRGKTRLPGRRVLTWHQEYPHHTAVVDAVRDGGKLLTLLHQNVGRGDAPDAEKRRVRHDTLRPSALQSGGHVWIYRPVAPGEPVETPAGPGPDKGG